MQTDWLAFSKTSIRTKCCEHKKERAMTVAQSKTRQHRTRGRNDEKMVARHTHKPSTHTHTHSQHTHKAQRSAPSFFEHPHTARTLNTRRVTTDFTNTRRLQGTMPTGNSNPNIDRRFPVFFFQFVCARILTGNFVFRHLSNVTRRKNILVVFELDVVATILR